MILDGDCCTVDIGYPTMLLETAGVACVSGGRTGLRPDAERLHAGEGRVRAIEFNGLGRALAQ
jgi:hypothetical protein